MNDDINETPSNTSDFRTELAKQLAELIPEAIADGKVDVTKLKELLGEDYGDESERFGLSWPGKKRALRAAQEPTTATLKPESLESKDWHTTENVYIEGDNLEVLKILQKHYYNKIKVIYIDPPYNTGNDFIYPDNYTEGLQSYLEFTRQVDEEGRKLRNNSETEGRYHTNWLNMMYPRLKLARNLISSDGLIAISIDDNEASRLQLLCDEIFGETNFISIVSIKSAHLSGMKMSHASSRLPKLVEYVLLYARNKPACTLMQVQVPCSWDEAFDRYTSWLSYGDVNDISTWERKPLSEVLKERKVDKAGREKFLLSNSHRIFRTATNAGLQQTPRDGRFRAIITSTGLKKVAYNGEEVLFASDRVQEINGAPTAVQAIGNLWTDIGINNLHNEGGVPFKNGKKPLKLLDRLITLATGDAPNSIVLDFFSGSATTAHAVMQLNAQDGGNRRFIQVQLPEPTLANSEARKAGFKTIAEIGRKRIDLTGEKIKAEFKTKLITRETPLDIGYRTYQLADTNFPKWKVASHVDSSTLQQELLGSTKTRKDNSSYEDLLTELLLKQGYSLTEKISHLDVEGLNVRSVGDNHLLSCLDTHVKPTLEQFRAALAKVGPAKFVILDDVFQGDDELKTNLAQICKSKNIELWTA